MSDFDEVLERLVTDASFQSALAQNPDAALAGYQLDPAERELLRAQVVADGGDDRTVETRVTKSSVVGLLGPVAAAFGVAAANLGSSGVNSGTQSFGAAHPGAALGDGTLGRAPGTDALGRAGSGTLGTAPQGPGKESFGEAVPTQTFGAGVRPVENIGTAMTGRTESVAAGYQTRVDIDGDGSWDSHSATEAAGGGVDIQVDSDGDGVTDFVGHDYDRDGLVDVAEFDTDRDGVLDTRMYDDTGDGWMDRGEDIDEGGGQTLGPAAS